MTPNIYTAPAFYPVDDVPLANREPTAALLYVTDRFRAGDVTYGSERSQSMVAGNVRVGFGERTSWESLATASSTQDRANPIRLDLANFQKQVQFPATPLPFRLNGYKSVVIVEAQREYDHAKQSFQALVRKRLKQSGSNELQLLVHGVNTDFETGAVSLADVWHFTGRCSVPILYSWPSGRGGLFGYFTDRESGEFTIFHLKETLRMLRAMPEVKRIHIIAHCRGTDVATTALRELMIETRASGRDPRKTLKNENLIFAAPGLDFGVVSQRLIAEQFGPAIGRITINTNRHDRALGLSQSLMAGVQFGRLEGEEVGQAESEIFNKVRNVHFIGVKGASDLLGAPIIAAIPQFCRT
ncbi:MAG: alpha/beta hydrolase [Aquisalinus sp.]|nr:alpha/beta hydrolase [Aquisalinus sp.]